MKKVTLIFITLFATSYQLNAQISLSAEYFGKSNYLDDDTEEKLGKGSAIIYQANVNIPISQKLNEREQPIYWGINFGGSYVNLNNKNFTDDLVLNEIMNLSVGISHIRPISEKWSMMMFLGAGIYSPTTKFSKVNSKNILGNGAVLFVRDINKNLKLGGGIAINNSFGFPMAFPAIYVNWNMDKRFLANISLMDGFESSFGYSFSKQYTLSAVLNTSGQLALVEKEDKDKIFSHQSIVTGLKNEFKFSDKISIPITVGVNIMRMAEYRDRSLKSLFSTGESGYFDVSPYISTGVNINF